ncbi:MAG TPA: hypothetical protein VHK27_00220, partial [Gammaproteobacteria bacterium]|nr:hypothetical protein [Gammaproteobacteria bacterium]
MKHTGNRAARDGLGWLVGTKKILLHIPKINQLTVRNFLALNQPRGESPVPMPGLRRFTYL